MWAPLWAVLPPAGTGCSAWLLLHGSSKDFRKPRERHRVSPSTLPLCSLAPKQGTVSCFSVGQFIWASRLSLEGHLCQVQCPPSWPQAPSSLAPTVPFLRGHIHTARFFGLRSGMVGKGLSPLLCLSLGVEPGKALAALMSSFGSKPLIPILRLLSGSLCLWREWFPGWVRDASVRPPNPVPIIRSDVAHPLTGPAAAAAAEAAQSRPVGRGGGQHCDRCCGEPVHLDHLPEVSSPGG